MLTTCLLLLVVIVGIESRCEQYLFSGDVIPHGDERGIFEVTIPNEDLYLSLLWTIQCNHSVSLEIYGRDFQGGNNLIFDYPEIQNSSMGAVALPYRYESYTIIFLNPVHSDQVISINSKFLFMKDKFCIFEAFYQIVMGPDQNTWELPFYPNTNKFLMDVVSRGFEDETTNNRFNLRISDYLYREVAYFPNITGLENCFKQLDHNDQYILTIERMGEQTENKKRNSLQIDILSDFEICTEEMNDRKFLFKQLDEAIPLGDSQAIPFDSHISKHLLWSFTISNTSEFSVVEETRDSLIRNLRAPQELNKGLNKGYFIFDPNSDKDTNRRRLGQLWKEPYPRSIINITNSKSFPDVNVYGKFIMTEKLQFSIELPRKEYVIVHPEQLITVDIFLKVSKYVMTINSTVPVSLHEIRNGDIDESYMDLVGPNVVQNEVDPAKDNVYIIIQAMDQSTTTTGTVLGVVSVQLYLEIDLETVGDDTVFITQAIVTSIIDILVVLFLVGDFYFAYCVKRKMIEDPSTPPKDVTNSKSSTGDSETTYEYEVDNRVI